MNSVFDNQELLASVGQLAIMTTAVVEMVKQMLPKEFPTQIVTFIVGFAITFIYYLAFNSFSIDLIFNSIFISIIVSFASMNGFDTLKNIQNKLEKDSDENE